MNSSGAFRLPVACGGVGDVDGGEGDDDGGGEGEGEECIDGRLLAEDDEDDDDR